MFEKYTSIFSRFAFVIAFLLMLLAIWDWILRIFGWTLSWIKFTPGRLIEFSVVLLIFVIAIVLRQIREEIRTKIK